MLPAGLAHPSLGWNFSSFESPSLWDLSTLRDFFHLGKKVYLPYLLNLLFWMLDTLDFRTEASMDRTYSSFSLESLLLLGMLSSYPIHQKPNLLREELLS